MRLFQLTCVLVLLGCLQARAHDSARLRAPEGSAGRGEARIDEDSGEIRIRGDRLPANRALSIMIASADGDLARAFTSTTNIGGQFDVRARARDGLPFGAAAATDFVGRAVRVMDTGPSVDNGEPAGDPVLLLEGNFPSEADDGELGVGTAPLSPPVMDPPIPGASGRIRSKAEGGRHRLEVKVRSLTPETVYQVCVTNDAGETENIGSITTTDEGNGALEIDTDDDGGSLPFGAGGVGALIGFGVTVKQVEGDVETVVLGGTIPDVGQRIPENEIEVEFDLGRPEAAPEPDIRGDVKFQTESRKDKVRVRLSDATAGALYRATIQFPPAEGEMPAREMIGGLEADTEGKAELEIEGRPVLPLGASSPADLEGAVVEVSRVDEGDQEVLVLSGTVPAVDNPPAEPAEPVEELEFNVVLEQPTEPVIPNANGKVEFEEQDDEHEIEVQVEDLVPGEPYRVELRHPDGRVMVLADEAANDVGDVRNEIIILGSEPLPFLVASFRELEGSTVAVLDQSGATVLSATVAVPMAGGGAQVGVPAVTVRFSMVGEYDTLFLRGDANADNRVDVGDPIFLLGYLFQGDSPQRCLDPMDANDDGRIDISDAIYDLIYLFVGGNPTPFPGPSIPGFDPTADDLFCED